MVVVVVVVVVAVLSQGLELFRVPQPWSSQTGAL